MSANVTEYPRAPITEAVIEIRVARKPTSRQLDKVGGRLKKEYPNIQSELSMAVMFDQTGGSVGVDQREEGFRATSDDQTDIVLARPGGLTVARLTPYVGWEAFRERASDAWEMWRKEVPSRPIVRLGVRYINRIDVPWKGGPAFDLEDYLRVYPETKNIVESVLGNYMLQVTLATKAPLWNARITSTLVTPPPLLENNSILLDIDVFRTEEIPQKDDALWAVIDEAREIKNDLFERCITDKARELFL